jgi:hypothetical protein
MRAWTKLVPIKRSGSSEEAEKPSGKKNAKTKGKATRGKAKAKAKDDDGGDSEPDEEEQHKVENVIVYYQYRSRAKAEAEFAQIYEKIKADALASGKTEADAVKAYNALVKRIESNTLEGSAEEEEEEEETEEQDKENIPPESVATTQATKSEKPKSEYELYNHLCRPYRPMTEKESENVCDGDAVNVLIRPRPYAKVELGISLHFSHIIKAGRALELNDKSTDIVALAPPCSYLELANGD